MNSSSELCRVQYEFLDNLVKLW